MITLEQAKKIFAQMIADSGKQCQIDDVWEIEFDDPIYVMMVIDEDGNQQLPGILFPAIRKSDGAIINYEFPCPA